MSKVANEKLKERSTKENSQLDLDNEIVIGLKTTPSPKKQKKKENSSFSNQKASKKKKSKKTAKEKTTTHKSNKIERKLEKEIDRKVKEHEAEMGVGIAEKTKKKQLKPKKGKNRKLTKQQELAMKKRKKMLRILKWTSLFLLLIAAFIYFLLSPFFNIKTITVTGNEKIKQEEIISLSQIQLGQNTFQIKKEDVKQAIKQNAYIDTVTVKRKLPEGIQITVTERTPSFMIKLGNGYIYVSSQGYLLEISSEELKAPIITGYKTPEEELITGNRLCKEDLQKLGEVLQIMESANSNQLGQLITKINIENKNNYILELKSEKKNVHLGNTTNLSTKMLYILEIIEKEKQSEGEILVNTDLNSKGATFREKV